MKPHRFVLAVMISAACSSSSESGTSSDASVDTNDGASDGSAEVATDSSVDAGSDLGGGGCGDVAFVGADGTAAPCDCEAGTICVQGVGIGGSYAFCTPIVDECHGTPTCDCMGNCVCEAAERVGCATVSDVGITCTTATSRRDRKRDIHYIDDGERADLAARALSVPLATYQYKTDAPDARHRLGFIIDDQPDPSFAVDDDRTHVDLYGYTSMLLATVQQQHDEIEALKKRVATLEAR
jgi:hypothetical protein